MKGFIGPIGDDLPSLIAIMLALTLFFSGLTYSMNTFEQKRRRARIMKGALGISRAITKGDMLPDKESSLKTSEANFTANNSGLAYNAGYDGKGQRGAEGVDAYPPSLGITGCGNNSMYFNYLISRDGAKNDLDTLRICVWEAE